MASTGKPLSLNKLASSPHYDQILSEYNIRLEKDGKVNNKKFYEEVVSGLVPGYSMRGWYAYIKRYTLTAKKAAEAAKNITFGIPPAIVSEEKLEKTMLSNQQATQAGIQAALNLGGQALLELLQNPQLLTPEKRADIMFKAMRAQDSRITAIKSIREDDREQKKFDRAFDNAAY